MGRYLLFTGALLSGLAFATQARADVCTVESLAPGYTSVSCNVSGTTVSGSPGDTLAQFTLPEVDPSLGQPVTAVVASFYLEPSGCAPMGLFCTYAISGNASVDYGPQCEPVGVNPSPPPLCFVYRPDNFGYGAVLSVTGPNGSFSSNAGYGSGFVLPPNPDMPQEVTVPWSVNTDLGLEFGASWPTGTDELTFTISVAGTCTEAGVPGGPPVEIFPCADLTSVNPFSYSVNMSYMTSAVPEPSLLGATALIFGLVVMIRRRRPAGCRP
jgi:hypothetical protein